MLGGDPRDGVEEDVMSLPAGKRCDQSDAHQPAVRRQVQHARARSSAGPSGRKTEMSTALCTRRNERAFTKRRPHVVGDRVGVHDDGRRAPAKTAKEPRGRRPGADVIVEVPHQPRAAWHGEAGGDVSLDAVAVHDGRPSVGGARRAGDEDTARAPLRWT